MPLGGTRGEAMQRLQIGLFGLGAVLLMVALASVVMQRANEADALAVPEAVTSVGNGNEIGPAATDPLVDAGVVPDLPRTSDSQHKSGAGQAGRGGSDGPRR